MSEVKRFCSECGKQCGVNEKFCSGCGHPLKTDENNQTEEQIVKNENSIDTPKKKSVVPGVIVLGIGLLFLASGILSACGLGGVVETNTVISEIVMGGLFCLFGGIRITRMIKGYGWGIAAVVFISCIIGSLYPFNKSCLMGSLMFLIVPLIMFIRANVKKK